MLLFSLSYSTPLIHSPHNSQSDLSETQASSFFSLLKSLMTPRCPENNPQIPYQGLQGSHLQCPPSPAASFPPSHPQPNPSPILLIVSLLEIPRDTRNFQSLHMEFSLTRMLSTLLTSILSWKSQSSMFFWGAFPSSLAWLFAPIISVRTSQSPTLRM